MCVCYNDSYTKGCKLVLFQKLFTNKTLYYAATYCILMRKSWLQLSRHQATNILQYIATHCNTLQHTAIRCNTLQYTEIHCSTLKHTTTHCKTLQHTPTYSNTSSCLSGSPGTLAGSGASRFLRFAQKYSISYRKGPYV